MPKRLNTIVLIDDDDATNFLNSLIVKRIGCAENIKAFTKASEAVDFLKTNPHPDLILLDINMPLMDGWDFLDTMRGYYQDQSFPTIIMLTSSIDPNDEIRANQYKYLSGYLSKPLTTELLLQILQEYFNEE